MNEEDQIIHIEFSWIPTYLSKPKASLFEGFIYFIILLKEQLILSKIFYSALG